MNTRYLLASILAEQRRIRRLLESGGPPAICFPAKPPETPRRVAAQRKAMLQRAARGEWGRIRVPPPRGPQRAGRQTEAVPSAESYGTASGATRGGKGTRRPHRVKN